MQIVKVEGREVSVYNLSGEPTSKITLPPIFSVDVRPDLIRRAVLALNTSRLQPKGTDPMAGERTTAESWGVGYGVARVPRVKDSNRAALVPQAVGGRRAHPPRVEKKIRELINRKERRLATISAIAATASQFYVERRGHIATPVKELPIIISDEFEKISKSKDVREVFKKIGVWDDVMRAYKGRRVRAGKGKMRGRKYKVPKSVLIVVSSDKSEVARAARAFPGVDVVSADRLTVTHLAPGGVPGRLTIYTVSSLEKLDKRFRGDLILE